MTTAEVWTLLPNLSKTASEQLSKYRTAGRMLSLQYVTVLQAAAMPFNLKLAACPAGGLLSKLEPCGSVQGAL